MTVITGPQHIARARVLTLRAALRLEIKGIKHSGRRSVYSIVKQEFGFKGNKDTVLAQLNAHIDTWSALPHGV